MKDRQDARGIARMQLLVDRHPGMIGMDRSASTRLVGRCYAVPCTRYNRSIVTLGDMTRLSRGNRVNDGVRQQP